MHLPSQHISKTTDTGPTSTSTAIIFMTVMTWGTLAVAVFIAATTLYGIWHFFSPVPYWDQWDGYVHLYTQLREGMFHLLWSQHNEHRIVFSRLLFLADIELFGGLNVFTLLCNVALLAGIAWLLWRESKTTWTAAVLVGLLFSWVQRENLTWGFQSQCIAVYFFSLLAFVQLSRETRSSIRIAAALAFCTLATISMGNGFISFGVAAIQAALLRRPAREWIAMLAGGVVAAILYFHGYQKSILPIDPSVANIPFAQFKYFAIFMGNPFAYMPHSNLAICAALGMMACTSGAALIAYLYWTRQITPYRSILIAGLFVVLLSAIGVSHSRWILGLGTAVSSRYTTTMLIGYSSLALLAMDCARSVLLRNGIAVTSLATLLLLTAAQAGVTADNSSLYARKLAVLGQKIGLDHPDYDSAIYPAEHHDHYVRLADEANAYQIGLWGKGWLHDAGIVKFDPTRIDQTVCSGYFESIQKDNVAYTASGWAQAQKYRNNALLIVLTQGDRTVGYGVSGANRADVAKVIKASPSDIGWIGFTVAGKDVDAYAYVGGKFCKLTPLQEVR